jgi:hypothetical protein
MDVLFVPSWRGFFGLVKHRKRCGETRPWRAASTLTECIACVPSFPQSSVSDSLSVRDRRFEIADLQNLLDSGGIGLIWDLPL